MNDFQINFGDLAGKRYTYLPSRNISPDLLKVTMSAFATLVRHTLPELLHQTQIPKPEKNSTPLGYSRRDGSGANPDVKHYLHFTQAWAANERVRGVMVENHQLRFFISCASRLALATIPLAREIVHQFNAQFPHAEFQRYFLDAEKKPCLEFRFLAYDQLPKGSLQELGRAHFDKSGFTLGMCESRPGLEVQGADNKFQRVSPSAGNFSLILGESIQTLSKGGLRSARHRVADYGGPMAYPPTEHTSAGVARIALVCFIDSLPGMLSIPDTTVTHR